jgi:hypothetical protein
MITMSPVRHQFDRRAVDRQTQREVDAAHRGEDVRQDAVAVRIAGHVVEQHRLVAHLAHVEIDDAADLRLALGAGYFLHLAGGPQRLDPRSQILPGPGG